MRTKFDREASEGSRDKTDFVIEADGECIGHCGPSLRAGHHNRRQGVLGARLRTRGRGIAA
jgi:hypothetical protein